MTKPNVFIVESLEFDDEKKGWFEGKVLHDLLNLNEKECKYYYIRTKKELSEVMKIYNESQYRYIHFSCHGNKEELCLTLDNINFKELSRLMRPHIKNKRIFVSACSILNRNFINNVLKGSGCTSIVGTTKKIAFNDAAISFLSLYHMLFDIDNSLIKSKSIAECLAKIRIAFNVELEGYFLKNGNYIKSEKIRNELEKIKTQLSLLNFFGYKN